MPQRQNARAGMHGFASQARTLLSGVPALERSVRDAEATVWMPIGEDTIAVLHLVAPCDVGGLGRVVQPRAARWRAPGRPPPDPPRPPGRRGAARRGCPAPLASRPLPPRL